LDLHPDCFVIVPTQDGPDYTPIRKKVPYTYRYPDAAPARFGRFNSRSYDVISSGLKTATVRYRDPVEVGSVLFVFEDDDGYRRIRGVIDQVASRRLDALTMVDAR